MRILFLLKYNINQASSRVRGFFIAEELKKRNIKSSLLVGYNKKNYIKFLFYLFTHNIIYFQKRYSEVDIKLNKLAKLLRKKTVFDIDDAPFGTKLIFKESNRAEKMMQVSSIVTVGSNKLKEFALNFNKNVYLIPSCINLNFYKISKNLNKENFISLGWIGNGKVYKDDLLMLRNPLEKIAKKYDNIKLLIVGALSQKEIYHGFKTIKNLKVEIIDEINWANSEAVSNIISKFDIGLYPLLEKDYNEFKCGYKALEYWSVGIPVIASPVGENKFIIDNGVNGFLAFNNKDWVKYISYLIENEKARKEIGRNGRKKVEKYFSLDICVEKLLNILLK